MLKIVLNNLDDRVVEELQQRADQQGRSLEEEIKLVLWQSVKMPKLSLDEARLKFQESRQKYAGRIFSDSVELLREDRLR